MTMTIEVSHGKARPTLPRSGDLTTIANGRPTGRQRSADGRFVAGNSMASARGVRLAVLRMLKRLSKLPQDGVAAVVAGDAERLFGRKLAELPSDAVIVRSLLGQQCFAEALAAFWSARAMEVGLDTVDGREAQEIAMRWGQRAERLTVTTIDVANKLPRRDDDKLAPWEVT